MDSKGLSAYLLVRLLQIQESFQAKKKNKLVFTNFHLINHKFFLAILALSISSCHRNCFPLVTLGNKFFYWQIVIYCVSIIMYGIRNYQDSLPLGGHG